MGMTEQPKQPVKAIAYLRVSKQAEEDNWGLDAQRAAIEKCAVERGAIIESWHVDDGYSGDLPIEERPGLDGALAACLALKKTGGGLLIVSRFDRIARNMMISLTTHKIAQECKCVVVSASQEPGNGSSPEDELCRTLVMAMAAYERQLIRMRTKAALAAAKAAGKHVGAIGIEFRRPEVIVQIYEMRCKGLSYKRIAKQLNVTGVKPPRPDAECWHPSTVQSLCVRLGMTMPTLFPLPPKGMTWAEYFEDCRERNEKDSVEDES